MTERLIIRNFAGLKEIDIHLSQINVLIGPQATGKSICAKSLYFFKSFLNELSNAVETDLTKRQFDAGFLQKFQNYFPVQNLEDKDFVLRYEINDNFIQVERNKSNLKLAYSDYYKKEFGAWKKIFRSALEKSQDENQTLRHVDVVTLFRRRFFVNQRKNLGEIATYNQVFIPAGRSFFALLQSSIFSFLSSNNAIDPFLTEFGRFYEGIKLFRPIRNPRDDQERRLKTKIDILIEAILYGKHMIEKGADFLLLSDGRKISIANSSSGQQEMLPLALILRDIPFRSFGGVGNTVYIEEPEAHLFPTAQRSIVELIATIFNESRIPVQFIITTHSPYILAAFNNLIYAGNIYSALSTREDKSQLKDIVPEEQLLKSEDIQVYSLHDGICESIISEDTGLITMSSLDEVSDELASQFDSILNIE